MDTDTLLQTVRTLGPDQEWKRAEHLGFGAKAGVETHLADGRWVRAMYHDREPVFRVDVSKLVRELPIDDGETPVCGDVSRFYAGRTWNGPDLAEPLAAALSDLLEPQDLLGLRLYPHKNFSTDQGWLDETGRYEFMLRNDGKWEWELKGRIPDLLRSLFVRGGQVGGQEPTLAEAVASALAAPSRLGALLTVMGEEYSRPPALPSWTFAGQAMDKSGERVVVGPMNDLLLLKAALSEAERPFYGHMNTDESFIAGVCGVTGLDAQAVLTHPTARRLKRY